MVVRRSAAERAGLEVSDVVLEVNEQAVATRESLREVMADVSLEAPLRLTIRRGGSRLSVTLRTP